MSLDPQRVRQLHALKLKSLVTSALGDVHARSLGEITGTDTGAFALQAETSVAFLAELEAGTALGPALAVAARADATELHLFAPADDLSTLARRAEQFAFPITVWSVAGATAEPITATPGRPPELSPPRVPELVAVLESAGADVTVEHGVITGEVNGLEIARIVPAPANPDSQPVSANPAQQPAPASPDPVSANPAQQPAPAEAAGAWRIEVGVGAHDRTAFAILHANEPTAEAVKRVADLVRRHRTPGAEPHPFNRLAAARWLRALLIEQPALVGAKRLTAAAPPVARQGALDKAPAVSYGINESGKPVVVVTSVGIDLDLVPFAADARAFLDDAAQLIVAVPQRDAHPLLSKVLAWLPPGDTATAQIVSIANSWAK